MSNSERHASMMLLREELVSRLNNGRRGCHYVRHVTDAALLYDTPQSRQQARLNRADWLMRLSECRALVRSIRALDATVYLAACYASVSK